MPTINYTYYLCPHLIIVDRDPRKKYALEESVPNIAFCLFQAAASSAALCILRDVQSVNKDLAQFAKEYLAQRIHFDVAKKTVFLPEIISYYAADFGTKKSDFLQYALDTLGPAFNARFSKFKTDAKTEKVRIDFIPRDFTPVFSFRERSYF